MKWAVNIFFTSLCSSDDLGLVNTGFKMMKRDVLLIRQSTFVHSFFPIQSARNYLSFSSTFFLKALLDFPSLFLFLLCFFFWFGVLILISNSNLKDKSIKKSKNIQRKEKKIYECMPKELHTLYTCSLNDRWEEAKESE